MPDTNKQTAPDNPTLADVAHHRPFPKVTMFDCAVIGVAAGVLLAVGYAAGARSTVTAAQAAPVIQQEYLVRPVWAPSCAPNFAGRTVESMPARGYSSQTVGTAETGDGQETVRVNKRYDPPGKYVPTPYERAQRSMELKYYRDMLKPSK